MLMLSKPSAESIRSFLSVQAKLDFTYTAVGATAAKPPDRYVLDHIRVKLGDGEAVYNAAKLALERWEQFDLGWLATMPPETPIKTRRSCGRGGPRIWPVLGEPLPNRLRC